MADLANFTRGFSVAHLNIRSIRTKIDEIELVLRNSGLDILTISESWLHAQLDSSIFTIDGYKLLRQDRNYNDVDYVSVRKRGGGLLAYLTEDLYYNTQKYNMLNRSDGNLEMQIFTVKKGCDKETVILNLYRPPSGNFESFMNHIQQVMDVLNSERYLDIYILGDVNLDHLPPIYNEQTS